jgi:hypothetical protein
VAARSLARIVCLGVVCATALPARAEPQRVRVSAPRCSTGSWAASTWGQLLRVEMKADDITVYISRPGDDTTDPVDVGLVDLWPAGCSDVSTTARLTCTNTAHSFERQLDLIDVAPVARPRVIAIAVADAVRACAVVLPTTSLDVETSAPPPQPPPPPPPRSSTSSAPPLTLGLLGEARSYTTNATALFGPRAFLDLGLLSNHFVFRIDAGVLRGTASDTLGTIAGTVASAGAGLRARTRTGGFELGAGVRGELGYGWFSGSAGAPTVLATHASSSLAYLAATLTATRLANSLGIELDVDAGTTVHGFSADADTRPLFDAEGFILAVRLGLILRAR